MTEQGRRWEVERAVRASALPPLARLVALTLLTRADADTAVVPAQFSPSLTLLAQDTGMGRRSVARHLSALETDGWVTRLRDPRSAATDKRPTRYRLHIPASRTERPVADRDQSQDTASARGALVPEGHQSHGETGATAALELVPEGHIASATVALNQTTSRPKPDQKKDPASGDPYAAPGFAEFWDVYPLKKAKRQAASAYRSALKRDADPQVIIKGAVRYRDDPSRNPAYTKHPATWLNGDCWADEPGPRAGTGRQAETDAMFDRAMQRALRREGRA